MPSCNAHARGHYGRENNSTGSIQGAAFGVHSHYMTASQLSLEQLWQSHRLERPDLDKSKSVEHLVLLSDA